MKAYKAKIARSQIPNYAKTLLSGRINPSFEKKCLVLRYGAMGDTIMASSVLPLLQKQGYQVTYLTSADHQNVLTEDPNIDDWMIVPEKDIALDDHWLLWRELKPHFDKFVNLFESIEGSLLVLPHDMRYQFSTAARDLMCSANYLEVAHKIAEVPLEYQPKFYAKVHEAAEAHTARKSFGQQPVIGWVLEGSAFFKYYPFAPQVIARVVQNLPVKVTLLGRGASARKIRDEVLKLESRNIYDFVDKQEVREAMTWVQYCDLVVGPETGLMHVVSFEKHVAKVLYLSHSSSSNLGAHWPSTITLVPNPEIAKCYPCHKAHQTRETCPQVPEAGNAALCATTITPEVFYDAIIKALTLSGKIVPSGYTSAKS